MELNSFWSHLGEKNDNTYFYKVKNDDTGRLIYSFSNWEESNEGAHFIGESRDFLNWVDFLHFTNVEMTSDERLEKMYDKNIGIVISLSFDDNTLEIIELHGWWSIDKLIFDLSSVELSDQIKNKLTDIQKVANQSSNRLNKHIPLINDILNNRILPILQTQEFADFMWSYEVGKSNAMKHLVKKHDSKDNIILAYIYYYLIMHYNNGIIPKLFKEDFFLFVVLVATTYYAYLKGIDLIETHLLEANLDKKVQNHLLNSKKSRNFDDDTLKNNAYDILSLATNIGIHNNPFFLSFNRDITILECYSDPELKIIEIELLNIAIEYINYHRNGQKKYILGKENLEDYFMLKIKEIESKIDLKGKTLISYEDDIINYVSENSSVNNDGTITLFPVSLDEELRKKVA